MIAIRVVLQLTMAAMCARSAALCWLGAVLVIVSVAGCGRDDRPSVSHNGEEQGLPSSVAQREQIAENEEAVPLPGAPVPGLDEPVTTLDLLEGPYVILPGDEPWCVEHVEFEPDFAYVVPVELTAESPVPEDLRDFVLGLDGLDFERYEHRWFYEERLVLFTRTPWGVDGRYAASAVELFRLSVPPGWTTSEIGTVLRCE